MLTYSVKADNCNAPKITYEVNGLAAKSALFLANHLAEGFRDVRVICEQTGEVMFNIYYNDDFRKPSMSELECLAIAQPLFKD